MKKRLTYSTLVVLLFIAMSPAIFSQSASGDLINLGIAYPVQVVWDAKALVANKSTAIRLFIQSTFTSRVWVDINVTYNLGMNWYLETGPYGDGIPIDPGYNTVYIPGGPTFPARPIGWWTSPIALFWNRTGNDDNIGVSVDPSNEITEANESNNDCGFDTVRIAKSRKLRILVARAWHFSGEDWGILHEKLRENMRFVLATYPVADNMFSWSVGRNLSSSYTPGLFDADYYYHWYIQDLSVEARCLGYDKVVVLIHGRKYYDPWWGLAVGMLREPEDRVPVIVVDNGIMAISDLIAHEIGHTYYLWHPHDIGPPVNETMRYWVLYRDYQRRASTFMSYRSRLPEGVPIDVRWIDNGRYDSDPKTWIDLTELGTEVDGTWRWNLFDQLTSPEVRIPVIVISGFIFNNGTVDFDKDWYRLQKGKPDILSGQVAPQKGNYTILMLNEERQVLSQTSFNASFTYLLTDSNDTLTKQKTDTAPFVFSLPFFEDTRFIQIRNSTGQILAERTITTNSPTVEVIFPNGGEYLKAGANYTITWKAYDQDGDELSYLIAYSQDNGENWIPLASNVKEKQYVWDTSSVSQGNRYLIKVIATDGINTGEDMSDNPFEILDLTPPVISNITQSPPQDMVQPNRTVIVKANVTDLNSGVHNVTLSYRYAINNETTWSAWKNISMTPETEITYTGNISGFSTGALVHYKVFAIDNASNIAVSDNNGKYYVYEVIPEFPSYAVFSILIPISVIAIVLAKKKHNKACNKS